MSLQQGRSDYGPPAKPLQPSSSTEGNTREGYTETWNLDNKQARSNNQIFESIYEIYKFNRLWQIIAVWCNYRALIDMQWLYIVNGMQRPMPRAETDPVSPTYNQE